MVLDIDSDSLHICTARTGMVLSGMIPSGTTRSGTIHGMVRGAVPGTMAHGIPMVLMARGITGPGHLTVPGIPMVPVPSITVRSIRGRRVWEEVET